MAGSSEIKAGKAFVEIGEKGLAATQTKLKAFGESFNKLGKSVSDVGTKLMGWSMAALAPLGASLKAYTDIGGQLVDMSASTGMTVEALGALGYAAEQSGMDMETLAGNFTKYTKLLNSAVQGNKQAQATFEDLGLSWESLAASSPEKQIDKLADNLKKIQNPQQRVAILTELFGKSGAKMSQMLEGGSKGLKEFREEAERLGYILSKEDAEAAESFGDSMANCWKSIKMVGFHIAASLRPALEPMLKSFVEGAKVVMDWVKENQGLIVSFAKMAAIAFGVGAGLFIVGKAATTIGWAFGGLSSVVGIAKTLFSVVGNVFLWFVTSPVALIVAGVVGLVAYFSWMCSTVSDSTTSLSDLWNAMKDDFNEAFGTIIESLKSGNLAGAMKVAGAFLQLEWVRVVTWLTEKWVAFKDGFQNIWTEAVYGVSRIFTKAWAGIQTAVTYVWSGMRQGISGVTSWFRQAWVSVIYWFQTAWGAASAFVSKGWIWLKKTLGLQDKKVSDDQMKAIDEQAKKEQQARDEQVGRDFDAIDRQRAAESQAIDADKKSRMDAIDAEEKGSLDASEDDRKRKQQARESENKKKIDDLKAQADAAKREFDDANQQVHQENKKRQDDKKKKKPDGKDGQPPLMGFESMKSQASVAGTFSAWAVNGMGGTKVEGLLTKMEKHLNYMATHTDEGQLTPP